MMNETNLLIAFGICTLYMLLAFGWVHFIVWLEDRVGEWVFIPGLFFFIGALGVAMVYINRAFK